MDDIPSVQAMDVTPDPVTAAVAALIEHDATCSWCAENLNRPGAAQCSERVELAAARRRALRGAGPQDPGDG